MNSRRLMSTSRASGPCSHASEARAVRLRHPVEEAQFGGRQRVEGLTGSTKDVGAELLAMPEPAGVAEHRLAVHAGQVLAVDDRGRQWISTSPHFSRWGGASGL